jgi:hypothetical protein
MPTTQPLPPKKEVALALLERSSMQVHLDPRRDAVIVPPWLKRQPQLVLQIGLNLPTPIPDLKLDDDGMSCTLSFNRAPFYCVVPWSSVFAMLGEDGRGLVWPDDVPPEVARQAQVRAVDGGAQKEAPRPAAALSAAPEDGASSTSPQRGRNLKDAKAEAGKPRRARKRPALAAVSDGSAPAPKRAAKQGPHPATRQVGDGSHQATRPAGQGTQQATRPVQPEPVEKEEVAVAPAPVQAARPAAGAAKKKRELPPYLRVVK